MTVRGKTGTDGRGTPRVPPPPGSSPGGDHLVLVDGADTTPDFLANKITTDQPTVVVLSVTNPGGNETLQIHFNAGALFPVPDNVFSVNDNVDPTKFLNVELAGQATGTTQTIVTTATVSRPFRLPDISGTALVAEDVTGFVYIGGQTTQDHGSNARVQLQSAIANGAQLRTSQYGANNAAPGLSAFKSRGASFPTLAGVIALDPLWRMSCVGVAPDNASIPLAAFITIQVPAAFVPAGQNFVPSEYELQLVPLAGPINSRRTVFKVGSEGDTQTLRGVRVGGISTAPATIDTGALLSSSSGVGNPNGVVLGSPGDVFIDQQPATTYGAGIFVKATGVATNTGWILITPNEVTVVGFVPPTFGNFVGTFFRDTTGIQVGDYVSIGSFGAFLVTTKFPGPHQITLQNDGHATQGFAFVPSPIGLQVLPCPKPQTRIIAESAVGLNVGASIDFGPFTMTAQERSFIEVSLDPQTLPQVVVEGFNVPGAVSYHRFINPGDPVGTVRVHIDNNTTTPAGVGFTLLAQNI